MSSQSAGKQVDMRLSEQPFLIELKDKLACDGPPGGLSAEETENNH